MSIGNVLDNTKMYRLPYSKNDNPNGWIEVTTLCNMKCPGCYKGIDRGEITAIHEPLEKIKTDILELKRIRNCGIITISGGEALMHPDIEQIVGFVKAQKLKSFILTNGILIKETTVQKLKKAGLTGFIVSINMNNRPEFDEETKLHAIRNEIADLIHRVGGLQLGFTCVITGGNLMQMPDLVRWFQTNSRKVDYLVLVLKREFCFEENQVPNNVDNVSVEYLAQTLKEALPEMVFSSYLGAQNENVDFKWVQCAWISLNGKVLGYADTKMVEMSTMMNHLKYGNYSYVTNNGRNLLPFSHLIGGSFILQSMRHVFGQYILAVLKSPLNLFKKANNQVINIVNPPSGTPETRDICDACPDAVLYEGKLQPSCILESMKQMQKKQQ